MVNKTSADSNKNALRYIRPSFDAEKIDVSSADKEFADYPRALAIISGGNVKVDTIVGNTRTFTDLPEGYELKVVVTKVYSSDTTATNIIAYYD